MDIRSIIREALGDMRFPSGAMTPQAHVLITSVQNNAELFSYALEHGDDKEGMFHRAVKVYERHFKEKLGGDIETVFYDFLAHYKKPSTIAAAEHIFGDLFGSDVIFNSALGNTKFTVNVKNGLVATVQDRANKAGYVANVWGEYYNDNPWISMKVFPKRNP